MKFQSINSDNTSVTYTNTYPLDSTLQLLWMLWKRGGLSDEIFFDDVMLLSMLQHIKEGNKQSHSVAQKLWVNYNAIKETTLLCLKAGKTYLYLEKLEILFRNVCCSE